jgi:probable phosphoglycerate mutase
MKELILIRHGQSENRVRGLVGGWTDAALTELGRQQAQRTGQMLASLLTNAPFQLYSSDLARARETAEIIGQCVSCPPILVRELRELDPGIAANQPIAEAAQLQLPVTEPVLDWIPYPQAESWRMMQNRVVSFLERLAQQDEGIAVLVAHGSVIVATIYWWLALPEELIVATSFEAELCSLTRLRIGPWGERVIAKLNETGHLVGL